MIQMTNVELLAAGQSLRELAAERLPIEGALRVRRVIREVQGPLDDTEAVRQELLRRHGKVGEDGRPVLDEQGNVKFDGDGLKRFQADYTELMAQTVEIEQVVRVADLGSIEIAPAVLMGLGALLEEE